MGPLRRKSLGDMSFERRAREPGIGPSRPSAGRPTVAVPVLDRARTRRRGHGIIMVDSRNLSPYMNGTGPVVGVSSPRGGIRGSPTVVCAAMRRAVAAALLLVHSQPRHTDLGEARPGRCLPK